MQIEAPRSKVTYPASVAAELEQLKYKKGTKKTL